MTKSFNDKVIYVVIFNNLYEFKLSNYIDYLNLNIKNEKVNINDYGTLINNEVIVYYEEKEFEIDYNDKLDSILNKFNDS